MGSRNTATSRTARMPLPGGKQRAGAGVLTGAGATGYSFTPLGHRFQILV